MHGILAWADNSDPTQTNFILLLISAGAVIGVCVLVGLVIALSRRWNHRHADFIMTAAIVWGLITAGSIVYAAIVQLNWAHQYLLDLESGYANPQETGPALPWLIWLALAAVYLVILFWTMWRKA